MRNYEGRQVVGHLVETIFIFLVFLSVGCQRALEIQTPHRTATPHTLHEAFRVDTGGADSFYSHLGILSGPLTLNAILRASREARTGTSNLRVTLDSDAVIGGRAYLKGDVIDTGFDLPRGRELPLGFVKRGDAVSFSCGLCHSSYDPDSDTIIDGAPNKDLHLGLLLALASRSTTLFPYTDAHPWRYVRGKEHGLSVDGKFVYLPDERLFEDAVDKVLLRWPPGYADLERDLIAAPRQIPALFGDSSEVVRHPFSLSDGVKPHGIPRRVYEKIIGGPVTDSEQASQATTFIPPLDDVDPSIYTTGRTLFISAGCVSCHNGNPRRVGRDEVGIPVPRPQEPSRPSASDELRARMTFGEDEAIRVPSLLGLTWSAPYLSDGGVAVSADGVRRGIADTLLVHLAPDSKESLRALLDRKERAKVIEANRSDNTATSMQIDGSGHLYWVDEEAGYGREDQNAIIYFLMHYRE